MVARAVNGEDTSVGTFPRNQAYGTLSCVQKLYIAWALIVGADVACMILYTIILLKWTAGYRYYTFFIRLLLFQVTVKTSVSRLDRHED